MKQPRRTATYRPFLLAAGFACVIGVAAAQQPGQRTFKSAEEACSAYFRAAQNEDEKALLEILGPAGRAVVYSGDSTQDADNRAMFVVRYMETHRLAASPDGATMLYVGAESWRLPIPLASKSGVWYFDTVTGSKEIVTGRIARNEAAAVRASRDLFDAQALYYMLGSRSGPAARYAQQFVSDDGDHSGLFWRGAIDEFDSPLDPLIAFAGMPAQRTDDPSRGPLPFNGYYFRILAGQGSHARGGARTYLVNGQMVGGFAFMAYPVEYGASGVMTFVINQDGVVYGKDLGPDTARIAGAATQYDPDSTWQAVTDLRSSQ